MRDGINIKNFGKLTMNMLNARLLSIISHEISIISKSK